MKPLAVILAALAAAPLFAAPRPQVSGRVETRTSPTPEPGPDARGIWRGGSEPFLIEIDGGSLSDDGRSATVTLRCTGACPELIVAELWPARPQCRSTEDCEMPDGTILPKNPHCEDGYTNVVATWRPQADAEVELTVPTMWPSCLQQGPPAILNVRWGVEEHGGSGTWIQDERGYLKCGLGAAPLPPWRFGLCP